MLVESRQPAGACAGGSQIPPPHVLRDPSYRGRRRGDAPVRHRIHAVQPRLSSQCWNMSLFYATWPMRGGAAPWHSRDVTDRGRSAGDMGVGLSSGTRRRCHPGRPRCRTGPALPFALRGPQRLSGFLQAGQARQALGDLSWAGTHRDCWHPRREQPLHDRRARPHSARSLYPTPQTVATRSPKGPSFLRRRTTWASTVRSTPP